MSNTTFKRKIVELSNHTDIKVDELIEILTVLKEDGYEQLIVTPNHINLVFIKEEDNNQQQLDLSEVVLDDTPGIIAEPEDKFRDKDDLDGIEEAFDFKNQVIHYISNSSELNGSKNYVIRQLNEGAYNIIIHKYFNELTTGFQYKNVRELGNIIIRQAKSAEDKTNDMKDFDTPKAIPPKVGENWIIKYNKGTAIAKIITECPHDDWINYFHQCMHSTSNEHITVRGEDFIGKLNSASDVLKSCNTNTKAKIKEVEYAQRAIKHVDWNLTSKPSKAVNTKSNTEDGTRM